MLVFEARFNFSQNESMWLCQIEALNRVNYNSSMCMIKCTLVSFVSLLSSRRANHLYEKVNISPLKSCMRSPSLHSVGVECVCYGFWLPEIFKTSK